MDLDKILVFGDSLTQWAFDPVTAGWVAQLAHAYVRKADVINRGYSGFNSRWCRHLLQRALDGLGNSRLRLAVVFLGANDAVLGDANAHQHVPKAEFVANVGEMVRLLRERQPDAKIVVVTPPPVVPATWGLQCAAKGRDVDRTVAQSHDYAVALGSSPQWASLGDSVAVLDTWAVFFGSADSPYDESRASSLLRDGLHFNADGNQLFFQALLRLVSTQWPQLDPATFSTPVVWWDKVDPLRIPDSIFSSNHE